MAELTDRIRGAGDPLELRGIFDDETREAVEEVASARIKAAAEQYPGDSLRQVREALLGVYAHGFVVGSLSTL